MKVKVVEERRFVCGALPGIHFSFPVFKKWEPKNTEIVKNGCVIRLNWPDNIGYESARLIRITKLDASVFDSARASLESKKFFDMAKVRCSPTSRNPHGVIFGYAYDPGLYIPNFKPPADLWDYLHFYTPHAVVRIEIHADVDAHWFSIDQFVNRLTDTFTLDQSSLKRKSPPKDRNRHQIELVQMLAGAPKKPVALAIELILIRKPTCRYCYLPY